MNDAEAFKAMLEQHTAEEMDRHDQLISKINVNHTHSADRHDETQTQLKHLQQSIENWMAGHDTFICSIKRAFPRDDEGLPDYDGHRSAHLGWISDSKESAELKGYIKKVVLGAAAIAITSWVTLLLWQGVLVGPK